MLLAQIMHCKQPDSSLTRLFFQYCLLNLQDLCCIFHLFSSFVNLFATLLLHLCYTRLTEWTTSMVEIQSSKWFLF